MYYNQYAGTMPSSIAQIGTLENFLVQNNYFHGYIDMVFTANFTDLTIIDISNNAFTGPVPSIGYQGLQFHLTTVHAIANCFTGSIPTSICDAHSLQTLFMDGLSSGVSLVRDFQYIANFAV